MNNENQNGLNGFNPGAMPTTGNTESEKINPTDMPTSAGTQASQQTASIDPNNIPTAAPQAKVDITAMPTAGAQAQGSNGGFDISKITSNKPLFFGIIGGVGLLLVIIIVVVIVGNSNKLVCYTTEEALGMKEETKYVIKFKGGQPSKVEEVMTVDYTNYNGITEEQLKEQAKELDDKIKEQKDGPKISYSINGKIVTMTATYTGEDWKKENEYSLKDVKTDKEGLRKYFTDKKYTCK